MDKDAIRLLLIEDNPGDARLIEEMLKESSRLVFSVARCGRISEALAAIDKNTVDVILLDLALPDSSGLETFIRLKARVHGVPILLLTGLSDENLAVDAVRAGAQDYLVKGQIDNNILSRAISYAIERKRAEQRLAMEKERLAVTLAAIGDAVVAVDTDSSIISLNQVAADLSGWDADEALGKKCRDVLILVDGKTDQRCECPVKRSLDTGTVVFLPSDTVLITRGGARKSVEGSAAIVRGEDNTVVGVVMVFRDVGDKRRVEQEMIKVQKLEALGVMAGGIAHDFNNILTAILNNISYAKVEIKGCPAAIEILTDAERATAKAKDLTHQLITFSKGGVPIKEVVALPDIIAEQLKFTLRGAKAVYELQAADGLWPVEVDVSQFNQMINNVVINAIQSMPDGGVVKIKLENVVADNTNANLTAGGRYVNVIVQDQGVGIPAKYLDRVFDPYFSTKQDGSGLGLAVTYSIVKRHCGAISVESELGVGTVVSIYLLASDKAPASKPQASLESLSKGSGRVLLMDDEQMILNVITKLIKKLGYDVESAKTGEEAIEIYKKSKQENKPISVIIMDLTIPGGMGGKEAIKELVKIDPNVKVIVSSGYSDDPIMAEFAMYGFKGVLAKPYDLSSLSAELARVSKL